MSNESEFVNALMDEIRKRGAMDKLITDSAQIETSARVKDALRMFFIDDWQSEPKYQHQNFSEHRWRHLKRNHKWFMSYCDVNPHTWLLLLKWLGVVMNQFNLLSTC